LSPPTATDEQRPAAAIDPRIRARRIAVRRDVGRQRLHRFGIALGVAAVVLAGVGVVIAPLLDVDRVVVTGAARVDPAAVRAATGIEVGDTLLTVDAGRAVSAVRAVPWVSTATVSRSWPSTVEVAIVERTPVAALLGGDGQAALVDEEGRILEVVAPEAAGVVLVDGVADVGPAGSYVAEQVRGVLVVAAGLPDQVRPVVERVVLTDEGELHLALRLAPEAETIVARLGDDRDLPFKLSALATVLASVDLGDLAVIDLAVPSAPALTPRLAVPTISPETTG
jgi:cell division protein FtsQ